LEKSRRISETLRHLEELSRSVGTLVNEMEIHGRSVCDGLLDYYTGFLRNLNDARAAGSGRSAKTMLRARHRLVKSIQKWLIDWQAKLRKANQHTCNAVQISLDLNAELPDQTELRSPAHEQNTVQKMLEFLQMLAGMGEFDDIHEWLRLIPNPLLVNHLDSIASDIGMLRRSIRLLEDIRISLAMLLSVLDAFSEYVVEFGVANVTDHLNYSSEDILERFQRQVRIISRHVELSPWKVVIV